MAAKSGKDGSAKRIRELEEQISRHRTREASLLERGEWFRDIAENVHEVCWLFDVTRQAVVYVNRAYENIWGRPAASLCADYREWTRSIHPDDLDFARNSFERIVKFGGGEPREYRIVRPDGSIRWVLDRGYAIRDTDGRVLRIAGIAEDITDRKQAEKDLQRHSQYMKALHDTAVGLIRRLDLDDLLQDIIKRAARLAGTEHGYIYLYDVEKDELVLRFAIGNLTDAIDRRVKRGQGLAGKVWTSGRPLAIPDYKFWPQRINDPVFDKLRAAIGIPLTSENHVTGVLGLGRYDDARAFDATDTEVLTRFAELASIAIDNARLYTKLGRELSERLRIEEILRRYEKIVATSKDLMALVDKDFVFMAVSDSYLKAHHKRREEIIGSKMSDQLGRDLFEKEFRSRLERCLQGEEVTFRTWFEFAGMGKRYMEATYYPFREESGSITGIVVVSRDITEKRQLQEQLLQSQKMEAIGTLAGGIAHDFNNLMMGIQGRTSMMLLDIDDTHPHFEHLKGIEEHVRSASDLTRQLLGFARGGKYESRAIDLNAVIKEKNRMFGRMQKGVDIQEKLEPGLWAVEADRSQLEQMLLNLYINAWQAMADSGTLCVQTENHQLSAADAEVHGVGAGRFVKLSVTDTGIGMDEDTRSRIFEPFFTTKDIGRGTGLGLASVYGIVQNHGGFITVRSRPGKGSTFEICLPASSEKAVPEVHRTGQVVEGRGTILLVDDEEMILGVASQMLRRLGYEVLTADGGENALRMYQQHGERIDLVILDVIMPGIGGGETYEMIRSVDPDVKVLLSSGYSINGKAGILLKRGCRGFIQKPFDLTTLSQKIREITGE